MRVEPLYRALTHGHSPATASDSNFTRSGDGEATEKNGKTAPMNSTGLPQARESCARL